MDPVSASGPCTMVIPLECTTCSRPGNPRARATIAIVPARAAPISTRLRLTRLARHLDRDRSAAFAGHGLEGWEFDVLAALRRAGEPYELSPGQLVAETLVTSGTMTNRIDRLVARGLVARRPDPADGRGVLVRLTPQGGLLVDTALADLLERERALLASLGPADAAMLAAALRRLVGPFELR